MLVGPSAIPGWPLLDLVPYPAPYFPLGICSELNECILHFLQKVWEE